jgi:pimeloyl-ACP methyl ester carboxylesterase
LVLVNTFARFQLAGLAGLRRGLQRLWLLETRPVEAMARFVAAGLFPRPSQRPLYEAAVASLSRNPKATYRAAIGAIRRFDARAGLAALGCPALVVIGDRDSTVPRAAAEALWRGIPGAQRLVLEDSGHASPMDQPERFNAEVLKFVESVDGSGP